MADGTTQTEAEKPVEHATLVLALCAAQIEFDPVLKTATNPHLRAKYATLDGVLAAVVPSLNKHGLLLIQPPRMVEGENLLVVDTTLIHAKTGDKLVCTYPVAEMGGAHQAMGAALTYARRYSLTALLGVFPEEDDDGQSAGNTGQRKEPAKKSEFQKPTETASSARKDGRWDRLMETLMACRTAGDVDDFMASDAAKTVPYQWRESLREEAEKRQEFLAVPENARRAAQIDEPAPEWTGFDALKRDLLDCSTKTTLVECTGEMKVHAAKMTEAQRDELRSLHAAAKARVNG